MCYINSRVFKSEDFKNEVNFAFRINLDPPKVHLEVIIGGEAVTYIPQKIMSYINIGFSKVEISKLCT